MGSSRGRVRMDSFDAWEDDMRMNTQEKPEFVHVSDVSLSGRSRAYFAVDSDGWTWCDLHYTCIDESSGYWWCAENGCEVDVLWLVPDTRFQKETEC